MEFPHVKFVSGFKLRLQTLHKAQQVLVLVIFNSGLTQTRTSQLDFNSALQNGHGTTGNMFCISVQQPFTQHVFPCFQPFF